MRESHACRLKTLISRIKDNFSRLTHKSGQIVLLQMINNENSIEKGAKGRLCVAFCVLTTSKQAKYVVF